MCIRSAGKGAAVPHSTEVPSDMAGPDPAAGLLADDSDDDFNYEEVDVMR